jgi:hypothetical protein
MLRRLAATLLLSMAVAVNAQAPQHIFYSGHSLLDEPLPRDVAMIAASLGVPPLRWDRHTPPGSSIGERLADTAAPRPTGAHDTLIVAEQHALVGSLVWNDSVRQLRRLHDRFIAANPRGRSWFYASWLNLDDTADPRRWIAHERAASPLWQCLATRINASLAAEGRADRIAFLPAGALLAALVERVAQGGVAGVRLPHLLRDDVHLSPLGSYFMSLVVFATLFERSPAGAVLPEVIDANAARALQGVAWELVQHERARSPALSLEACRERLPGFIATHAAYLRDAVHRPRIGAWRAWWHWAKHRLQWHWALREGARPHPLRLEDAASDKSWWLPPV